ncbi:MAG TPA: molybdopterin converting factor subunit 1 [Terriglobales bacterium]|nr:molybdopterin converting factor subunit 1 [Terriglobales bacterium]
MLRSPMRVQVLYFGVLKEQAGQSSDFLEVPGSSANISAVLQLVRSKHPSLNRWLKSIAVAVNQEYATPQTALQEGDEIALLPPVSGGVPRAKIIREPIDTQSVLTALKRPEDGAAVIFEGIVRNNTKGRPTVCLDYEAYEEMALKKLEALAEQAVGQGTVRDVAIVHRLGRLEIGETSVLIVVASAHRAAAFEACRWLIDTLKQTVPIWKKEYFEDGAVWADGEPFPAEIPRFGGTNS